MLNILEQINRKNDMKLQKMRKEATLKLVE